MAVAIRLKRIGRRNRPYYRIDAIEKRNARDGRSLETLGHYDPMVEDPQKRVIMNLDRVQFWLDKGARPSATVTSFFRKADVRWGGTPRKNRKTLQRRRRAERSSAKGASA